jgi:hypothetical protein
MGRLFERSKGTRLGVCREKWLAARILVVLALIVGFGESQTLAANPQLQGLAPFTWRQIDTGPQQTRYVGRDYTDCSQTRFLSHPAGRSYSGMDYGGGRLFYWGGAHHSYPGNDVELFDVQTNRWTQMFRPECFPECCTIVGTSCNTGCSSMGGGFNTGVTPLGRPYSEHEYDRQAYHARRGTFFVSSGSGAWEYNPATNAWTRIATSMPYSGDVANNTMFYDPDLPDGLGNSGTMMWIALGSTGRGIHRLNFATGTWDAHDAVPTGIGWSEITSAYDPIGRRHLLVLDGQGFFWYHAGTRSWQAIAGAPAGADVRTSVAYDPPRRRFLVLNNDPNGPGFRLWDFDPQSGSWTAIAMSGTPPVRSGSGARWGVLEYDDINNAFWYLNHRNIGSGGSGGDNEGDVELWAFVTGATPPAASPTGAVSVTPTQPAATATRTPTSSGVAPTATRTRTPTAAATVFPGTPSGSLDIPLTVRELLPAADVISATPPDLVGMARVSEPATFGVPLRESDAVQDLSVLKVVDGQTGAAVQAQFRSLPPSYPSGAVRWVLVDVQTDLAANGTRSLRLRRGDPTPIATPLASDGGGTITVNTGPASFTVRKASFNVIDRAVVNGVTLVSSGHGGAIRWQASDGTLYESRNDPGSTAVIEENGPLRAVVRAQGRLRSAGGTSAMGYTARLHFHAGHSYVRARVTIENAFRDDTTRKQFAFAEMRLPLSLGTGRNFALSNTTGEVTGTVASGSQAYLYQGRTTSKANSESIRVSGFNSFFREENDWGANFAGAGQDGFTIVNGASTLVSFGGTSAFARGYGDLSDNNNRGLTVAMRDFDSFYPSGIELTSSGEVAVEIFSRRNTLQPMTFDWGLHETRDILLDFHTGTPNLALAHYRVQYPLMGLAPHAQYRDTGGFLGRTQLVTYDEMVAYHATNDAGLGSSQFAPNERAYGVTQYTLPNQRIVRTRSYDWSEGGRQTNGDQSAAKLLSFLQTGHGGLFHAAYNLVNFITDQAVHRSDREDRNTWGLPDPENRVTGATTNRINGGSGIFEDDMEHENTLGIVLLYYLTGDQGIWEGIIDHGEWLAHAKAFSLPTRCEPGTRGTSQRAKWFAILYDLTSDPRYLTQLGRVADSYVCGVIADPSDVNDQGQDMDRGYYRSDTNPPTDPRSVSLGPVAFVRARGLWEMIRVLPDSDPRKEDLEDRLLGYTYFIAREGYFDGNGRICRGFGAPAAPGGNNNYLLDSAPADESLRTQFNMQDHLPALEFAARRSGDPVIKYVGRRIVGAIGALGGGGCDGVATVAQSYAYYADWPAQAFIYNELHPEQSGVVFMNDDPGTYGGLQVTNNGGGSYTLQWTVPPAARRYQIKYGPQVMVPNLNFDKYARTYQYNPAVYDNFWAGNGEGVSNQPRNITNEPVPGTPGSQQTHTITGLTPGQTYRFALRVNTNGSMTPPSPPRLL